MSILDDFKIKKMEKHLEFIQGVINRHNSNSFMIKGWSVTIVAAIFALAGTVKDPYLTFIAIGPIIMFWILDSIFLANERCFISLYTCVTKGNKLNVENKDLRCKERNKDGNKVELETSTYSMNFQEFRKIKRNNWFHVIYSYTIIWFYGLMIILTGLCFWGMKSINKPVEDSKVYSINATITTDTVRVKTIEPDLDIETDTSECKKH